MATVTLQSKKLKIQYDGGVVDGRAITQTKTFSTINEACTDDQLMSAATIINGLQTQTVLGVKKVEESELSA